MKKVKLINDIMLLSGLKKNFDEILEKLLVTNKLSSNFLQFSNVELVKEFIIDLFSFFDKIQIKELHDFYSLEFKLNKLVMVKLNDLEADLLEAITDDKAQSMEKYYNSHGHSAAHLFNISNTPLVNIFNLFNHLYINPKTPPLLAMNKIKKQIIPKKAHEKFNHITSKFKLNTQFKLHREQLLRKFNLLAEDQFDLMLNAKELEENCKSFDIMLKSDSLKKYNYKVWDFRINYNIFIAKLMSQHKDEFYQLQQELDSNKINTQQLLAALNSINFENEVDERRGRKRKRSQSASPPHVKRTIGRNHIQTR